MGVFTGGYEDSLNEASRAGHRGEPDLPTSFGETAAAAFDQFTLEDQSISARRNLEPLLKERGQAIAQVMGKDKAPEIYNTYFSMDNYIHSNIRNLIDNNDLGIDDAGKISINTKRAKVWISDHPNEVAAVLMVDQLARQHPGLIKTDNEIFIQNKAEVLEQRQKNLDVIQRGSGAAAFVGAAGGAVTDPVMIAALPFGATNLTRGPSLANAWRAFYIEGSIGALTEAAIQPDVAAYKHYLGSPYTVRDAAYNVLAAGLGGAVLGATFQTLGDVARQKISRLIERKRSTGNTNDAADADTLDQFMRDIDDNPFTDQETHFDAIDKAQADLAAGRAANVAELVDGEELAPHIKTEALPESAIDKPPGAADLVDIVDDVDLAFSQARARITDQQIPVDIRLEGDQPRLITRSAREVFDEIDADQSALTALTACRMGGGKDA